MAFTMTTGQAAELLGTTAPTIRRLCETKQVDAEQVPWGSRLAWRIEPASVEEFLQRRGRFDQGRRPHNDLIANLADEIVQLRGLILSKDADRPEALVAERDHLRERVSELQEAMAILHDAFEAQQEADTHRSAVIEHLLRAAAENEEADRLRRGAIQMLDEGLSGFVRPGQRGDFS